MSSQPPSRRCPVHDLAAAPDGKCTLCRQRGAAVAPLFEPEPHSNPLRWFFGTGLGASLGVLVWLAAQSNLPISRAVPPVQSAGPPLAAANAARALDAGRALVQPESPIDPHPETDPAQARPSEPTNPQPDEPAAQAVAADGAGSREQAAEQARKLEEAERDRKRHEAVANDLKKMAVAAARRNVPITMYSTTWCGVCERARAYMKQHDIAFQEFDVEQDAAASARAAQLNPRGSVPTIVIDDEVLIGFSPSTLETRLDRATQRRVAP